MLSPGLEASLIDSWNFFIHLGIVLIPLFIGGSFLVGLAQEYLPPEKVERKLRGHDEGTGNVAAAGLGAVTPFCSCSTVPILAGLLQAGAPLGLAFSFLLASPLVNEIAVILLIGLFGIKVTIYYIIFTFVAAIIGGIVIGRLGMGDYVKDVGLFDETGQAVAADGGTADGGTADCCASEPSPTIPEKTHRERWETAARGAWSVLIGVLPYLLLGMVVGALIHGVVPVEIVHAVLGSENPVAVPLASLIGAPIYISLSGMLPIAASLSEQGIAIGTVLAFVIGGAGVSLPNLVLLNKLFKGQLLAVYAGTVVTIGIIVGTAFNFLIA